MYWRNFGPSSLVIFLTAGVAGTLVVPEAEWWRVWSVACLSALVAWVPALGIARRLVRPLRELHKAARRIAAGQFGQKVSPAGRGELGGLARAFNAMSERLAAQFAQLEADREQLRMILGGMVEGVVAIDAGQCVRFANDRAGELLDFNAAAAVGRKLWEVIRQRPVRELVEKALATHEPMRAELDLKGPAERSLAVYVARLPGAGGQGAILVLHDTSDLRRLERLRHEFVANVSHELKTPLCVISSCVETLIDGAVDDREHRGPFLENIADQANRLQALILDLLSLARIESGAGTLEFEAVPLAPAVEDCLDRLRPRADGRRQQLVAEPPGPGDGLAAWADAEAVGQILDNLVDNAVKYTPEGGRVRVRWRGEGDQVVLEVEDNGIGIPPRDLPRVFERFYRVDKARSRELGGTGLGLSIVKNLAQQMKGCVRAASRPGSGSTFTVTLPRAPA
jgi:two-component system phosphate regulon sensor histidine kinase PhoR